MAVFLTASDNSRRNFADLTIEELMDESVTSVSKKETKLSESPAAIAVITQEDIRRSGHASVPELLRMVPGLDVARIHGNEWAVSARGFTGQYANKLLVLVDGRSVYSPMFAGVYWNTQNLMLEDIARIEVIRGPGATLWGSNAVNGVINITTRSSKETQGGFVTTSFGTEERPSTSIRYGGQLAPQLYYRAYASYFDRHGFVEPGQASADSWDMARVGARLDWEPADRDLFTFQADYYRGSVGEHFEGVTLNPPFTTSQNLIHHNFGGNVLGRWSREFSPASQLMVQAYFDRFHQWDGDIAETRDTFDLDAQHRFPLGARHDVVWGFGYRHTEDRLAGSFYLSFKPEQAHERLGSVFLQDEIALVCDQLTFTVGSKFEHNQNTGLEVQPSGRLLWTPTSRQTVWASISRAVRTPSRYDRDSRLNASAFQPPSSPPFLVSLLSSPDAVSEKLTAYEAGYRVEPNKRVSFDFAGFYNVYDRLLAYVAGPVVFENNPAPSHLLLPLNFENVNSGDTYGSEVSARWQVTNHWKLVASHTWLRMRLHPDQSQAEENPTHKFQLRSYLDLSQNVQLSGAAYYTGGISSPFDNARTRIDSYLRFDLGLSWRPTERIEIGIWGQNLLERRHAEYGSFKTSSLTEVPRSIRTSITWRY